MCAIVVVIHFELNFVSGISSLSDATIHVLQYKLHEDNDVETDLDNGESI